MKESRKKAIRKAIIILLYIVFGMSLISLVLVMIQRNINKTPTKLIDIYSENLDNIYSEEDGRKEEKEEKNIRIKKLEELQKQNKDIVAYIEIEGTNISYPVLQSIDNEYYLYKNYLKEYSNDGSIFLDKDVNLSLPSCNFLMYGHNNQNGRMFSDLMNYKSEAYYKEHSKIRFVTNDSDDEYNIMACFYSRVYYTHEKNVFRYYNFVNAGYKEEFDEYVKNACNASIYDTGISAVYGDQLLTLSACSYHTEDGRFVVVGVKKNNKW